MGQSKIALLTYGTRGDVQPMAALALGLRERGHEVRLAAPTAFEPFLSQFEIEFDPLPGTPTALARGLTERAGLNWPRMVKEVVRHALPLARDLFRRAERACEGADGILHSFLMTDVGHTLARRQRVPDLSAQFFPVFAPTVEFPAVAFPDLPLGAGYRKLSHIVTDSVFRYGSRLLYRRIRANNPDLPRLAGWPFRGPSPERTPLLLAVSPAVVPPATDWPSHVRVTGYWRLPPPRDWTPPEAVARFLEVGPPPVYLGLGTASAKERPRLLASATACARALGIRMVVGFPSVARLPVDLGEGLLGVADIPHEWLFPRTRFVVHHGGAGTTAAALAAGVPNVALPFTADQRFWARRIRQLAVGPAGVPAKKLTTERLQGILGRGLHQPEYQEHAEALGEEIRAEDGVARAVDEIEARLG